jgi:hypothetical protein
VRVVRNVHDDQKGARFKDFRVSLPFRGTRKNGRSHLSFHHRRALRFRKCCRGNPQGLTSSIRSTRVERPLPWNSRLHPPKSNPALGYLNPDFSRRCSILLTVLIRQDGCPNSRVKFPSLTMQSASLLHYDAGTAIIRGARVHRSKGLLWESQPITISIL